jgi:hypothetical protein
MTESVRDRTTKNSEKVFLLSKSARYFYDSEAIKEWADPSIPETEFRSGKNKRSVWSIPTQPLREAHFAAWPEKLVRPMIQAGTSEKGCCPSCGAPWNRIVERKRVATRPGVESKIYATAPLDPDSPYQTHNGDICGNRDPQRHATQTRTAGWEPTCKCPPHEPIPCTVLDNFAGSFRTAVVCAELGRSFVGTELNPKNIQIGRRLLAKKVEEMNRPLKKRRKAAPQPRMAEGTASKELVVISDDQPVEVYPLFDSRASA